jgi:hypothetical protein
MIAFDRWFEVGKHADRRSEHGRPALAVADV